MEYIRMVGEDEMHVAEVLDIREIKLSLQEYITDKNKVYFFTVFSIRKIILSKSHLAQTNWDFLT
jgi:hypothetical protein